MRPDWPACVSYQPSWVEREAELSALLTDQIRWEQPKITMFGRTVPTPRLTCWLGDRAYTYSGVTNDPAPWPKPLAELRDHLSQDLGVSFNSCLANLYRDGSDSMGYHRDNELELGPHPTIASISLGAHRRFVLRHRETKQRWAFDLGAGDLLVMRDESQSVYEHAVPKTARTIGPRMNLTFREFDPD